MGYSNYKKLKMVTKQFGVSAKKANLFGESNIPSVEPSEWLSQTLKMATIVPLINEKVKSERLVSP